MRVNDDVSFTFKFYEDEQPLDLATKFCLSHGVEFGINEENMEQCLTPVTNYLEMSITNFKNTLVNTEATSEVTEQELTVASPQDTTSFPSSPTNAKRKITLQLSVGSYILQYEHLEGNDLLANAYAYCQAHWKLELAEVFLNSGFGNDVINESNCGDVINQSTKDEILTKLQTPM